MASVTYWNRLEVRPRSPDIDRALGAEVRDPAWMLARQWQVGEFQGEDAASPAWVALRTRTADMTGWSATRGAAPTGYDLDAQPLERVFQDEPLDDADLSLAGELGLLLEDELLVEPTIGEEFVFGLRAAFPVRDVDDAGDPRWRPHDASARAFLTVCAGRLLDGVLVLRRIHAHGVDPRRVFDGFEMTPAEVAAVAAALRRFLAAAPTLAGRIVWDRADEDPPAWRKETLRYEAEASSPAGTFSITPDRDGLCDWWSFDLERGARTLASGEDAVREVQPAHVRFRGMPNARWWDFESAATDFGDVRVDRRDLARMAVMEFMLVQGNDWFMVPFQMHVGTACQVEALEVHDVFGDVVRVPRADRLTADGRRWTMFTTAAPGDGLADYFLLPPSAGATRQDGPVLEEVQFLRDEMANMAWAIEHTVPTQIGEPLDRQARGEARSEPATPPTRGSEEAPPLSWVVQTEVPPYWYPLLPTRIGPAAEGQIALRLGRTTYARESESARSVPAGRVLHAPSEGRPPQWREEEVPREGVRVLRRCVRSRWIDGSTHVWMMRARQTGGGEGSSGLRFDVAQFRQVRSEGGGEAT